jgi:hypothetical protein|eukprot:COSAG06_NODE_409_length_16096_cov_27.922548_1_plen_42_part_00
MLVNMLVFEPCSGKGVLPAPHEVFAGARWRWVVNELTPEAI